LDENCEVCESPAKRRESGRMNEFVRTWAVRLLFVALSLTTAFLYFGYKLKKAIADVNDPAQYRAVLGQLGYPKPTIMNIPSIGFFPAQVPADATNIRFFYRPHFLQGGPEMQLRFSLPLDDLKAVLQQARSGAIGTAAGDKAFETPSGVPIPNFRDGADITFASLPSDFQMFLMYAKDLSGNPTTRSSDIWLEGYTGGIAVSEKREEVIYWVEEWQ
jgi:hypothetical protein